MKRLLLLALAVCACGPGQLAPQGQLVVYVGTDAPLPSAPGAPPPVVHPLFDRIRVAVFEPGQSTPCAGCESDFAVDSAMEAAGNISFGVVLKQNVSGYVARIDMFRGVATQLGEPMPRATVTQYVSLPAITGDGIVSIGAFLSVAQVGVPQGSLTAPIAPVKGQPVFDKVGTWSGALSVPCASPARPGEVCVPGGAYWMGNPQLADQRTADDDTTPHLVIVSPFFIDSTEVTVGTFRSSGLAVLDAMTKVSTDPVDPQGDTNYNDLDSFCMYTTAPGPNEQYALNCISWGTAQAYCQARGENLVTEAQFEYAASGLVSSLYIWGDDPPSCSDAVWGRGGIGAFDTSGHECNGTGRTFGPLPPGQGARDILVFQGATLYDLTGNVSEWTADKWQRTTEPCWNAPILIDPLCTTVSPLDGDLQSIRGGAWPVTIAEIQAAVRNPEKATARPQTGLRCARPGK